jgi:hypothetical protein
MKQGIHCIYICIDSVGSFHAQKLLLQDDDSVFRADGATAARARAQHSESRPTPPSHSFSHRPPTRRRRQSFGFAWRSCSLAFFCPPQQWRVMRHEPRAVTSTTPSTRRYCISNSNSRAGPVSWIVGAEYLQVCKYRYYSYIRMCAFFFSTSERAC